MCRTAKLFLATLLASVVSAGIALPSGVLADELDDLLTGGLSSGPVVDEEKVRELLATLREAERQQAEKRELEQARARQPDGGDRGVAPVGSRRAAVSEPKQDGNAGAAAGDSTTGEGEKDAVEKDAVEKDAVEKDAIEKDAVEKEEADKKKEEPRKVIRAGCMYSGTDLIWEKVPGACSR
jgi:hypothetical protein